MRGHENKNFIGHLKIIGRGGHFEVIIPVFNLHDKINHAVNN